jgi:hypothetical protein
MAHCSSVTPGGEEALQCLQKNMSSLSSGCQSAVRAVEAPAAGRQASRDCQTGRDRAPKAAAPAAGNDQRPKLPSQRLQQPPSRTADQRTGFRDPQRAAPIIEGLRGRADRWRAGAAMPGKEKAKLSAGCEKAVSAASGGGAPAAAAPAAGAAPAASG